MNIKKPEKTIIKTKHKSSHKSNKINKSKLSINSSESINQQNSSSESVNINSNNTNVNKSSFLNSIISKKKQLKNKFACFEKLYLKDIIRIKKGEYNKITNFNLITNNYTTIIVKDCVNTIKNELYNILLKNLLYLLNNTNELNYKINNYDNNNINLLTIEYFLKKHFNKEIKTIENYNSISIYIKLLPNLFSKLLYKIRNDEEINILANFISRKINYFKLSKDSILFKDGDQADNVYIILWGEVYLIIFKQKEIKLTILDFVRYLFNLFKKSEVELLEKTLLANNNKKNCISNICNYFDFYINAYTDLLNDKENNKNYNSKLIHKINNLDNFTKNKKVDSSFITSNYNYSQTRKASNTSVNKSALNTSKNSNINDSNNVIQTHNINNIKAYAIKSCFNKKEKTNNIKKSISIKDSIDISNNTNKLNNYSSKKNIALNIFNKYNNNNNNNNTNYNNNNFNISDNELFTIIANSLKIIEKFKILKARDKSTLNSDIQASECVINYNNYKFSKSTKTNKTSNSDLRFSLNNLIKNVCKQMSSNIEANKYCFDLNSLLDITSLNTKFYQNNIESNNEYINNPKELNNNIDIDNIEDINTLYTINVFEAVNVKTLNTGEVFGNIGIDSKDKKRTATVITKYETHFGVIKRESYSKGFKNILDKMQYNEIDFIISNAFIFSYVTSDIIRSTFYKHFVFNNYNKNDFVFKMNKKDEYIYILKEGEFELNITNESIYEIYNRVLDIKLKLIKDIETSNYFNSSFWNAEVINTNKLYNDKLNLISLFSNDKESIINIKDKVNRKTNCNNSNNYLLNKDYIINFNLQDTFKIYCLRLKTEINSLKKKLLYMKKLKECKTDISSNSVYNKYHSKLKVIKILIFKKGDIIGGIKDVYKYNDSDLLNYNLIINSKYGKTIGYNVKEVNLIKEYAVIKRFNLDKAVSEYSIKKLKVILDRLENIIYNLENKSVIEDVLYNNNNNNKFVNNQKDNNLNVISYMKSKSKMYKKINYKINNNMLKKTFDFNRDINYSNKRIKEANNDIEKYKKILRKKSTLIHNEDSNKILDILKANEVYNKEDNLLNKSIEINNNNIDSIISISKTNKSIKNINNKIIDEFKVNNKYCYYNKIPIDLKFKGLLDKRFNDKISQLLLKKYNKNKNINLSLDLNHNKFYTRYTINNSVIKESKYIYKLNMSYKNPIVNNLNIKRRVKSLFSNILNMP